jgi:hypothetical protein
MAVGADLVETLGSFLGTCNLVSYAVRADYRTKLARALEGIELLIGGKQALFKYERAEEPP